MRARSVGLLAAGFLAGAFFVYYVLWRTAALVPGHPLALGTRELLARPSVTPAPLPTIPFPTPTVSPVSLTGSPSSASVTSSDSAPDAAATPTRPTVPALADFSLSGERLAMPVQGAKKTDLHDSFSEARGAHRHAAIDILAPRGTPVVAAVDGSIAKLFTSVRGGLTIYEFDRTATYCYYYAHLDRYADGLREGQSVRRGEGLGFVGTSGDAPPGTPHLHFTIFRLGPDKHWWDGVAVNPYPALFAAAS